MLYKDALLLTFFLDQDDPGEQQAYADFKEALAEALRGSHLGQLDGERFDSKGGFFELTLSGHAAETMLAAIVLLVQDADFLVGPRATLIIRNPRENPGTLIRHVDL